MKTRGKGSLNLLLASFDLHYGDEYREEKRFVGLHLYTGASEITRAIFHNLRGKRFNSE
jgi:hypothetical protein